MTPPQKCYKIPHPSNNNNNKISKQSHLIVSLIILTNSHNYTQHDIPPQALWDSSIFTASLKDITPLLRPY